MLSQLNEYAEQLEEAAEDSSTDAESMPDRSEAVTRRLQRARSLAADGHGARAAHHYKQLVDDVPTDATVHREYAEVLASAGYLDSSARHYERALELDPSPRLRADFASLLEEKGEPAKAARQRELVRTRTNR